MSAAIALDRRLDRPMNVLAFRGESTPIREMDDAAPFIRKREGAAASARPSASETDISMMLPVEAIRLCPVLPPRLLNEEAVRRRARLLGEHGPFRAIMVRPIRNGLPSEVHRYELITVTGEIDWEAARIAGVKEIPVFVRDVANDEALLLSLIEKLQREILNPIEKARACQALHDTYKWSQARIGRLTLEDRRSVNNTIRLLKLCPKALARLESGELTAGHGKVLLGVLDLDKQAEWAWKAAINEWSVRELEDAISGKAQEGSADSPETREVLELLTMLGFEVKPPSGRRGDGALRVVPPSVEELRRVLAQVRRVVGGSNVKSHEGGGGKDVSTWRHDEAHEFGGRLSEDREMSPRGDILRAGRGECLHVETFRGRPGACQGESGHPESIREGGDMSPRGDTPRQEAGVPPRCGRVSCKADEHYRF